MTGYKYKLTSQNGDIIYINDFVTDPLRFLALQAYPDMVVDVKNNEQAKEGQHGIFDFYSFYGKRSITFSGVIVGTTEADVEAIRLLLMKVLTLPPIPQSTDDGSITLQWTDASALNWQITAKLSGYPQFTRDLRQGTRLYFNFTLKAKDPQIESQELFTSSGVRGWRQGDMLVPGLVPGTFTLVYNKEMTINNGGATDAHTIIYLYGENAITTTNPVIYNETTGAIFKVNHVLTDATKYLKIDSKLGTVVDQDGVDRSGLVDGISTYITLNTGNNKLVFLSDESVGALSPVNTWVEPLAVVQVNYRRTTI